MRGATVYLRGRMLGPEPHVDRHGLTYAPDEIETVAVDLNDSMLEVSPEGAVTVRTDPAPLGGYAYAVTYPAWRVLSVHRTQVGA